MKYFVIILLLVSKGYAQQAVPADSFKKGVDTLKNSVLLDVRTPEEYKTGHIDGAENINIYDKDFEKKLKTLDKKKTVLVYCKGGGRSAEAAKKLASIGFTNVYDLAGGIMAWENKGFPVVTIAANEKANKFTKKDLETLLNENPLVLVDFYAPWCIPCKKMEPTLTELSEQYKGKVLVYRLNIDEAKDLAKELQVEGIPVLATYKNGKEVTRVKGLQSAQQLKKLITSLLK